MELTKEQIAILTTENYAEVGYELLKEVIEEFKKPSHNIGSEIETLILRLELHKHKIEPYNNITVPTGHIF